MPVSFTTSRIYGMWLYQITVKHQTDVEEELLVSRLSALEQVCEYTMDMVRVRMSHLKTLGF